MRIPRTQNIHQLKNRIKLVILEFAEFLENEGLGMIEKNYDSEYECLPNEYFNEINDTLYKRLTNEIKDFKFNVSTLLTDIKNIELIQFITLNIIDLIVCKNNIYIKDNNQFISLFNLTNAIMNKINILNDNLFKKNTYILKANESAIKEIKEDFLLNFDYHKKNNSTILIELYPTEFNMIENRINELNLQDKFLLAILHNNN